MPSTGSTKPRPITGDGEGLTDAAVEIRRARQKAISAAEIGFAMKNILSSNAAPADDAFRNAIACISDELEVPVSRMKQDLSVTQATISRWKTGASLPIPIVRKAVIRLLSEYVHEVEQEAIRNLKEYDALDEVQGSVAG